MLVVSVLVMLHKTYHLCNALNALNLEQSLKRSNRQKSNGAAMDNNYMLTVLTACLSQHDDTCQTACQ